MMVDVFRGVAKFAEYQAIERHRADARISKADEKVEVSGVERFSPILRMGGVTSFRCSRSYGPDKLLHSTMPCPHLSFIRSTSLGPSACTEEEKRWLTPSSQPGTQRPLSEGAISRVRLSPQRYPSTPAKVWTTPSYRIYRSTCKDLGDRNFWLESSKAGTKQTSFVVRRRCRTSDWRGDCCL